MFYKELPTTIINVFQLHGSENLMNVNPTVHSVLLNSNIR